jgi:hypothetical protein
MDSLLRKTALLLCVLLLSCLAGPAFAEDSAAEFPPIDPAPDFGGKDIWFYSTSYTEDYWARYDASASHTEEEERLHAYRENLQAACNARIHEGTRGDWSSAVSEMIGFSWLGGEEDKLAVFIFSTDLVGSVLSAGAAAPVSCDLSAPYWNRNVTGLLTLGGKVYGAGTGSSQPAQCLYFNRRVLTDAGVDCGSLYDLQSSGEWTWGRFEEVLKQVLDSDKTEAAPLCGSQDDLYQIAVLSAGASFVDTDADGRLYPTVSGSAAKAALSWAKDLWKTYSAVRPEGASWNWSDQVWLDGQAAFRIGKAYQGFSTVGFEGMRDEWGCLAFPAKDSGGVYLSDSTGLAALIPACYDTETADKLMQLYGLWTAPAVSDTASDDLLSLFPGATDSRAVNETYAMLADPAHQVIQKTGLVGGTNNFLGALLWGLESSDPDSLISMCMPLWIETCSRLAENIEDRSFRVIFPDTITPWTEPAVLIRPDENTASFALFVQQDGETVWEAENALPGRNAVPNSAFSKGGDFVIVCRALDAGGNEAGTFTMIYSGLMPME